MAKKQKDDTVAEELMEALNGVLDAPINDVVKETTKEETSVVVEVVPSYTSTEWEEYALSKFTPTELHEGKYPKLNGLRRVGELLLGDVIGSMPVEKDLVQLPDGHTKATVVYEVKLLWKLGIPHYIGIGDHLPVKTFRAIGNASPINTSPTFAIFAELIAENRSEARAWRKALRLSVVAYDELPPADKIVEQTTDFSSNLITNNQMNVIKQLCSRHQLDVNDFISSGKKKYTDIKQVPYDTAATMIQYLNTLGTKE